MRRKNNIKYLSMILILSVVVIVTLKIADNRDGKREESELEWGTLNDVKANELITQFNAIMHRDINYHSFYGGMYLEKQNLVILLVQNEKIEMELEQFLENEEDIVVRYVEHSLSSLLELQRDINSQYKKVYKEENKDKSLFLGDFKGTHIDEKNNAVVVRIKDITSDKIRRLKAIFGDDKRIRYETG